MKIFCVRTEGDQKMKGKDKGCAQGCEQEYGTYACWECPDPNAPTHLEIMNQMEKPIIEKLALLEHNQWSEWIGHMDKRAIHGKTTVEFTNETWNEWLRKASFHYCDLTEAEKESDRKFARKVLALLEEVGKQ